MSGNFVRIEGYAAIFGAPDLNGDVIARGAFAASIARAARGSVKMLYQHAVDAPVGFWTELKEDARGLFAAGELHLGTRQGAEAYALVREQIVDGLSIGFRTRRAGAMTEGQRRLDEIELWEISLVTFPMAPAARVTRIGPPPVAQPLVPLTDPEPEVAVDQLIASGAALRRAANRLCV